MSGIGLVAPGEAWAVRRGHAKTKTSSGGASGGARTVNYFANVVLAALLGPQNCAKLAPKSRPISQEPK